MPPIAAEGCREDTRRSVSSLAKQQAEVSMTIAELEALLMPQLEDIAARIRQRFAYVKANAHSYSVGSRTDYQGHSFCVDCFVIDTRAEDPDSIALGVDTSYLSTAPCINATVCWGHPSGQMEAAVFQESQPLTPETVGQVLTELPRLYEVLLVALAERSPSGKTV